MASWPVNRPERVPVRPQVRFFLPEPAARGEEAKSYLWCEVPAAGDLRVLLQKRPHLGVQRLADAPMAAALPAQSGASPPAPPSLGKGALPAQEKEPLPAAQGHVSPGTNPPQESSAYLMSTAEDEAEGSKQTHTMLFFIATDDTRQTIPEKRTMLHKSCFFSDFKAMPHQGFRKKRSMCCCVTVSVCLAPA